MIPASDLWMLGLRPARGVSAGRMVPTSGAAQPFRDMGELFPSWAARPQRRLTVGLTCSLHWGAARRLLAAFHEAYADVELVVEDLPEGDLAAAFETRHIDVAIAPAKATHAGWRALPLWRERLIAALPEASPLAQGNEVSPKDLRGETLLLAGDMAGQKAFQRAVIAALGGHPGAVKATTWPSATRSSTLWPWEWASPSVRAPRPAPSTPASASGRSTATRAEISYSLMWAHTQANDPLDPVHRTGPAGWRARRPPTWTCLIPTLRAPASTAVAERLGRSWSVRRDDQDAGALRQLRRRRAFRLRAGAREQAKAGILGIVIVQSRVQEMHCFTPPAGVQAARSLQGCGLSEAPADARTRPQPERSLVLPADGRPPAGAGAPLAAGLCGPGLLAIAIGVASPDRSKPGAGPDSAAASVR